MAMWQRQWEQELARLPNPREPGPIEQWEAADCVAYRVPRAWCGHRVAQHPLRRHSHGEPFVVGFRG
jgi:hypothetical protein